MRLCEKAPKRNPICLTSNRLKTQKSLTSLKDPVRRRLGPRSNLSFVSFYNYLVDRISHLVPAVDGGDDFVGIGGPDERLWVGILVDEEAVDGGLEADQRKHPACDVGRLLAT